MYFGGEHKYLDRNNYILALLLCPPIGLSNM